eukprot:TRINITY_DN6398_c0_g1_i1.p1 TRINITY_DN6398_c0_g1~~TRINITY_DN6398_c0_g1_i1.p1  ORF type:complete len:236 (-),score=17.28 TRINITY_DN6398_c0_g1_i1:16-723(-)
MSIRNGDWFCPVCKVLLFAKKTECRVCHTQKPLIPPRAPSSGWEEASNWNCKNCHFSNFKRKSCLKCNYSIEGNPFRTQSGDWNCSSCNELNFAKNTSCRRCSTSKPSNQVEVNQISTQRREGDWDCPKCQKVVFAYRNKCKDCLSAKPGTQSSAFDADEEELPDIYFCPITREVMKNPVIAADGHSYDKDSIELWISKGNHRSPMTNMILPDLKLIPNHALKSAIMSHASSTTK